MNTGQRVVGVICLAWFAAASSVLAAIVTNTFTVSQDVERAQNSAGSSEFSVISGTLRVGPVYGGWKDERSFLQFDLSAMDTGKLVSNATLRLYMSAAEAYGGAYIYPVTATWTVPTITYNLAIGSLIASVASPTVVGWKSIDVTSIVENWRLNPSQNYGFAIRASEGYSSTLKTFVSSTGTAGQRPELVVIQTDPPPTSPAAPTGLTATGGNAQAVLNWNSSFGALGYNVKRATVSNGTYSVVASTSAATCTNTGLANGTTYYFVVSATNAAGESADSSVASATPQVPAPAAPTGLSATAGDGLVALSWTASAGATNYTVKRSTSAVSYAGVTNLAGTAYTNAG